MNRTARAAYWVAPGVLCLVIYWLALKTWFRQDDFAWLSLHLWLNEPGGLWKALFSPMSFGTIRPLSERGFFLTFYSLFGLNSLPYRLLVFATQFANLVLLASVTWRITGSRTAGLLATVFWLVNSSLVLAMCWTSAYNQVLCVFFLLLSFQLLLRHIETGKRSFLVWQWVTFLLGFGALEVNIVYPAIAASYTWCCARQHFRKTLWMFIPSGVYAMVHQFAAPQPATGVYAMHFDASILSTLWAYWKMALGPESFSVFHLQLHPWLLLTPVLVGFILWKLWKKEWLTGFLVLCFVIVLGPFLPVRDHISDYYLAAPVFGLAMFGGWAVACASKSRLPAKVLALLAAAVYVGSSLPVTRAAVRWNYETSGAVKRLVVGVMRARELHPNKVILLTDVGTDLFWAGVFDKPFHAVGISDVYLVPGSEANIRPHPEVGQVSDYVLPAAVARRALEENRAVVYAAGGERLKNITTAFSNAARTRWPHPEEPRRVDAGSPLFETQLGPGWYGIEGNYRWMAKRATVWLGAPQSAGEKLHVAGYCPVSQVQKGPLKMTVSVDGLPFPPILLDQGDALFENAFPLSKKLLGKERVELTIEVDRTFQAPSDGRSLGLVFGTFAIR
jgi:hypothetical protein